MRCNFLISNMTNVVHGSSGKFKSVLCSFCANTGIGNNVAIDIILSLIVDEDQHIIRNNLSFTLKAIYYNQTLMPLNYTLWIFPAR